jgi:DNA-binding response OmpR family regulator
MRMHAFDAGEVGAQVYRLLVVDDEADIRAVIREYAEFEGHYVAEAGNGMDALQLCREQDFDIIIMDAMMPKLDGFSAAKKIRELKAIPILMLSARSEEYDKLFGFEMGVDDYVVKPFSPKELMARVKVIVTRNAVHAALVAPALSSSAKPQSGAVAGPGATATTAPIPTNNATFARGRITIDTLGHTVAVDGLRVELTPKEYDLLCYFVQNERIVLTRGQLLSAVWGYDHFGDMRTVDAQVKLLRGHLGGCRDYIVTVRGVGYKFEVQA